MDGYTLSISRCSGGDGVEESFKAKIKRRAEWLVHELTDAGEEVWEKDAADKEALS